MIGDESQDNRMERSMDDSAKQSLPVDEVYWNAVVNRDPAYNGVIFFAVRSTGIFCRPTCPARRPRRDQVRFFSTPQAARREGFRPCKRCQPELPVDPRAELVTRACREMEAAREPLSLVELSRKVGASPSNLHRLFKTVTGLTPNQYAAGLQEKQFRSGIKRGQAVTTALYDAGYGSSSALYSSANERLGMTPAIYQRGGTGMEIQYTIVESRLGRMLVAGTQRGICMISFGSEDAELETALRHEYPSARIQRELMGMANWVSALLAYLDGSYPHLDLPLDLQASAFQVRVWEELRRIPFGETRTYAQVAQAIGSPSAARAVGHACATNPVSVVTPCHRVLRSDGGLGGYRWGLERKKLLLEIEKGL
jgi:AraC family transcriptional regulator of adaptative response/methylated-DNA-[protein]-cysteine methyltransferase